MATRRTGIGSKIELSVHLAYPTAKVLNCFGILGLAILSGCGLTKSGTLMGGRPIKSGLSNVSPLEKTSENESEGQSNENPLKIKAQDASSDPKENTPMEYPNSVAGAFLTCAKNIHPSEDVPDETKPGETYYGCAVIGNVKESIPLDSWQMKRTQPDSSGTGAAVFEPIPGAKVPRHPFWQVQFSMAETVPLGSYIAVKTDRIPNHNSKHEKIYFDLSSAKKAASLFRKDYFLVSATDSSNDPLTEDLPSPKCDDSIVQRIRDNPKEHLVENLTMTLTVKSPKNRIAVIFRSLCGDGRPQHERILRFRFEGKPIRGEHIELPQDFFGGSLFSIDDIPDGPIQVTLDSKKAEANPGKERFALQGFELIPIEGDVSVGNPVANRFPD